MRGGDLSSEVVPRLALIFEGSLAFISNTDMRMFDRDLKRERWADAAGRWDINPLLAGEIWHVSMKLGRTVDVVTFLSASPDFQGALEERLKDYEELPIHTVIATTPEKFERKIAYMPDLIRVYDPEPMRSMRWGGKGFHITDAGQLGI